MVSVFCYKGTDVLLVISVLPRKNRGVPGGFYVLLCKDRGAPGDFCVLL